MSEEGAVTYDQREIQAYVVQRWRDGIRDHWEDIATVTLPKGAHRKSAVLWAVAEMEKTNRPLSLDDRLRVLDEEAAREYRLEADATQWKVRSA